MSRGEDRRERSSDVELLSFVPRHLAKQLIDDPSGGALGRELRFDAVALFADISGFTAISEALGRAAVRGAEELTEVLNGFFEPTIELMESFGGIVAKFGGDALTVLFPESRRSEAASRRAVRAARDLQARVRHDDLVETSTGDYRLTLRVGLARGRVLALSVGDAEARLEHVVAGRVLDRAAEAQKMAQPGEVVVDSSLRTAVFDTVPITAARGFERVGGPAASARRAPLPPFSACPAGTADAAARYLHPTLVDRVRAGHLRFINEHRRVTVVFGRFEDFDYDRDPAAGSRLQSFAGPLVRTVERYGGYLRQIHMGDKGSTYIALFGAPIAHDDDERRALRCALELVDLADVKSAIGVNTGSVFCGFVGSQSRREYAVIGDAVNVAARVMGEAGFGEIIVGDGTVVASAPDFTFDQVATLPLKGRAEPVRVSRLVEAIGALPRRRRATEMVGRAEELHELDGQLERALAGSGAVVGVTGEPGIGKSLLVTAASRFAAERGMQTVEGACEFFGTHIPYLPWREIWRALLGFGEAPERRQAEHVAVVLDALQPGLGRRAPLLGPVLGIEIPETDLTRSLDPELRRESLHSLLSMLLQRDAVNRPALVVLEDCHWLDESSRELLEQLARAVSELPLLLVCTYRPHTLGEEAHPLGEAAALPHFVEVVLSTLADDAIEELVRDRAGESSGGRALPDPMVSMIASRAGGNPFYAEELVNYVAAGHSERELPDTLRSLVLARIDELGELEKAVLRVASVIGRRFAASWVRGSYPPAGSSEEVEAHLQTLHRANLTTLEAPPPEIEYAFRHSTTQEVAYTSMAFSTREQLHESVGEFIEQTVLDGDGSVDLLAYHFGRSTNVGKQRTYFRRAGDAARAAFANDSAVDYYERLLPLVDGAERAAALCDLAAVFQVVGRWREAEASARSGIQIAGGSQAGLELARCQAGLGSLLSQAGAHADAIEWLEQARIALAEIGNRSELRRALEHLSYAHFWRSEYEAARRVALEELELAGELEDEIGQSTAHECLGLVHWHLGEGDEAALQLGEALTIADSAAHGPGVMNAANDLAGLLAEQGDYPAAFRYLQRAFDVAQEVGARRNIGAAVSNAGQLSLQQGDYDGAAMCFLHALRVAAELGRWTGILNAVGSLGVVCAETGHLDEAERLLDRAIGVAEATDDAWNRCFFVIRRGEVLARKGQVSAAAAQAREALAVAREVSFGEVELDARLLLAVTRDDVAELEQMTDELSDPRELAAVLYELWRLDPGREDVRARAASLYEELHAASPNVRFRRRFQRLSGRGLTDPPPLPRLSPEIPPAPALDEVVRLAERLSRAAPGVRRPATTMAEPRGLSSVG
jgi:class 3 adenylate cyclase/tetratricopeptide (TPR) repeat protein